MPIDREMMEKLLDELKDYIYDIENMDFSEEQLLKNRDIQHLLNHRLHLAVEICIDIAMHIVSALELPGRDKAADAIILLGENKIISQKLADKFQKAPKLRNLLIHGYAKIDYRSLYRDYKDDLSQIKQFAGEIRNYLEKHEPQ